MSHITIGADPEFFVCQKIRKDSKVNDQLAAQADHLAKLYGLKKPAAAAAKVADSESIFVPICGKLGGTKKEPIPIPGFGAKHAKTFTMQEDGAAVEFNIPPCASAEEFYDAINMAVGRLTEILAKKDLYPYKNVWTNLSKEQMMEFPHLNVIGCDPDHDAYRDNPEMPREIPAMGTIRGCGGHIHIGYPKQLCAPFRLAKLMDLVIALPMLSEDKQGKRRYYHGIPGLYRDKEYGVEYRTLSNFWIWDRNKSNLIAQRTFKLLQGLESNLIGWQAFYNKINWGAVRAHILDENNYAADRLIENMKKQFVDYARIVEFGK